MSSGFANKGTDQPGHLRRLISAFGFCFSEKFISKISTREIPIFYLVSVAEKTGLSPTLFKYRRQVLSR